MKNFKLILAGAVLGAACAFSGSSRPATAQEMPPPPPAATDQQPAPAPVTAPNAEPNCGTWQNGTWIPNGSCGPNDYRSRVAGTITAVKGHLVTIQQSAQTLVINDQPALDHRTSGRIAVGRQIVAWGYWRNGTFYATTVT